MQAIALFRITQESLNNVAKYARARHVVVHLGREGEAFTLEICDDGIGIPPDAMRRPKSHGLLGMRERALLLGGSLSVGRGVNGLGTTVLACIPVTAPGAGDAVVQVEMEVAAVELREVRDVPAVPEAPESILPQPPLAALGENVRIRA